MFLATIPGMISTKNIVLHWAKKGKGFVVVAKMTSPSGIVVLNDFRGNNNPCVGKEIYRNDISILLEGYDDDKELIIEVRTTVT